MPSNIYMAGVLTRKRDLCWGWRPPFSPYPSRYIHMSHSNTCVSQASKDFRASQETLVDIFERIERFFRRLETYTGVPPTPEMTHIIIQIMVEVLSILGIATDEITQGRTSE